MTDARWTEETESIAARAMMDSAWITESESRALAARALAAIADTGVLLDPEAERETVWAYRTSHGVFGTSTHRKRAAEKLDAWRRVYPQEECALVCRTRIDEPWREAPDERE